MFIDAHCHLTSLNRDTREEILKSAALEYRFIDSSIDAASSLASIALSDHYPFVYSALGFHPFSVSTFSKEVLSVYEDLISRHPKVIAVGEIGLDQKAPAAMPEQEAVFIQFLRLAKRFNRPVFIHNRLDSLRVLDILDNLYTTYESVVFHCFSYGRDFLERIIKKGGYVSFSLNILRNNKTIIDSLKQCPFNNMLLETDSPYMKIKNDQSTALDIQRVYDFVSQLRNIGLDQLKHYIQENTQKIFHF